MRCLLVLEDKELLDKARQGNKYCLNLLLQNNYQMLYGFLIKLTGDKDLAEDLVQDTLLKASLNITKFRGDSKFSSYLQENLSLNKYNYIYMVTSYEVISPSSTTPFSLWSTAYVFSP